MLEPHEEIRRKFDQWWSVQLNQQLSPRPRFTWHSPPPPDLERRPPEDRVHPALQVTYYTLYSYCEWSQYILDFCHFSLFILFYTRWPSWLYSWNKVNGNHELVIINCPSLLELRTWIIIMYDACQPRSCSSYGLSPPLSNNIAHSHKSKGVSGCPLAGWLMTCSRVILSKMAHEACWGVP